VRGVAVSVHDRDVVLTTDRGLYRSADGKSWQMPGDSLPAHLELGRSFAIRVIPTHSMPGLRCGRTQSFGAWRRSEVRRDRLSEPRAWRRP
jgi:hypothetical protein